MKTGGISLFGISYGVTALCNYAFLPSFIPRCKCELQTSFCHLLQYLRRCTSSELENRYSLSEFFIRGKSHKGKEILNLSFFSSLFTKPPDIHGVVLDGNILASFIIRVVLLEYRLLRLSSELLMAEILLFCNERRLRHFLPKEVSLITDEDLLGDASTQSLDSDTNVPTPYFPELAPSPFVFEKSAEKSHGHSDEIRGKFVSVASGSGLPKNFSYPP
ncbi:hypothetical protein AVEN_52276-1 [Araneus ventricosus]|uniref:Uncharacterized protein n=1 Tax=Araneus ventricosus TaxID=182803 RepID=A0A4Y2LQ87_ARAVE|nr:hypothetical protein AVEN_52276-1 [Araneus ventricosus]